ncbi:MAG: recombinase family protein [Cetobacterium sp.]
MKYGYSRVNTEHQVIQKQMDALLKYGIDENFIFQDKFSEIELEKQELSKLLSILRSGDTIVIKEVDKLGRDKKEVKKVINFLIKKNVEIVCLDMPYFKEFIVNKIKENETVLEFISDILLDVILEEADQKQKKIEQELLDIELNCVKKDKKLGRAKKVNLEVFRGYYQKFLERKMKAVEIQRKLGISKQSYYNYSAMLKNDLTWS